MIERESTWPDGTLCGAVFSDDERHRYLLWREFPRDLTTTDADETKFPVFLMLNPSTATHEVSDPTVTRCARFAARHGYASFQVCNLFSFRSTDPSGLLSARDAEGDPANLETILAVTEQADLVVCAWGTFGDLRMRNRHVLDALFAAGAGPKLRCLGRTAAGHPRHPLYLPSATNLERFTGRDLKLLTTEAR